VWQAGATINGVIFPATDLCAFDEREHGYQRIEVPRDMVDLLSWQTLPHGARIYLYVPYAPAVVAKYGAPLCSGAEPPAGLDDAKEGSGLRLDPPSVRFPILQTYIDVVVSGCFEHGEDFAREFIETTFKWSPYWLNERELARRPWLHQAQTWTTELLRPLRPRADPRAA